MGNTEETKRTRKGMRDMGDTQEEKEMQRTEMGLERRYI